MQINRAGTDIHTVLEKFVAAHAAHDVEALFALYADELVAYSLAPPLQQGPDTPYGTVAGIRTWFAGFERPMEISFRDPVVTQDGDLAFVHSLTRMTFTQAGANQSLSTWYRSTFGLRRIDGSWRIAHRHDSAPFYMDGTFRAATDLKP